MAGRVMYGEEDSYRSWHVAKKGEQDEQVQHMRVVLERLNLVLECCASTFGQGLDISVFGTSRIDQTLYCPLVDLNSWICTGLL